MDASVSAGSASPAAAQTAPATRRLLALDVLRGATVLLMILVNNPGSWHAVYAPLRHAEWNGWTPADLVFPFFLFILGVSLVFSVNGRIARGATRGAVLTHILWRSLALIAIGLILNGLFYLPWQAVRIPGVLQRIGLVYLFAALITLPTTRRARLAITAALLLGYWAMLMLIPVPGYGAGDLSAAGNLASFVDRWLMPGHLWRPEWDPEGVLSTLPAIATALLGTFAAEWLQSRRSGAKVASGLLVAGAAGIVAGELWSLALPINKNLWTSSFAMFSAGVAALLLGACYWTVEMRGWQRWTRPLVWVGMNPLAIYVGSEVLGMGALEGVRHAVQAAVFAPVGNAAAASLLWALAYMGLWWAVAWIMYRNTIFIKL